PDHKKTRTVKISNLLTFQAISYGYRFAAGIKWLALHHASCDIITPSILQVKAVFKHHLIRCLLRNNGKQLFKNQSLIKF
ncbi:hypothetical protein, partial [Morganella morganii]|uniref:hypothetical protein n=1 Tax=Morganella morganii TaxID=582 RepID=UPI0032DAE033